MHAVSGRTRGRASRLRALAAALAALPLLGACAEQNLVLPEDAAPAELAVVTGHGQEGVPGDWLAEPLVVEVLNAGGEPVPQVRVTFAFESGSGELNPSDTRTNAAGRAQAAVRLGDSEGRYVIVATVEMPDAGTPLRRTFEVFAVSDGGDDDDGEGDGDGGGGDGGDGGEGDGDGGDGGEGDGGGEGDDGGEGAGGEQGDGGEDGADDEDAARPETLPVPPGHLPARGECRVWYPGRSPGQQPGAESCSSAIARAPAGTWVVERRAANPDEAILHVIHTSRAGVVVARYVYDARTGRYLREV